MKFTELAKKLKEGLAPVYFVEGEDAYFREHAAAMIREACHLSMPALNEVRIEGESLKGERLRSFPADLNTLPFLDERRLVRVYGFYPTEKEWELLAPYMASPCPTTVLLIVNADRKKGAADIKKKSGVTFVDCSKETEEVLSRWIFSVLRSKGLRIEGDAATLLVRYCAQDAARIYSEAEKFRLLLGKEGVVKREHVEEYVAKDVDYKIYELTQAASRKNFTAFSEILFELTEKGFDEYAVLAALLFHYRTLCSVSSFRGSDDEAAALFGMKPYAVKKNREAARMLGAERVQAVYNRLYELSAGARSGGFTKPGAMTAALAEIFFG